MVARVLWVRAAARQNKYNLCVIAGIICSNSDTNMAPIVALLSPLPLQIIDQ